MRIISYPVSNENLDLGELLSKLDEEYEEFLSAVEFSDNEELESYKIENYQINLTFEFCDDNPPLD